jgi:hypothetical protein
MGCAWSACDECAWRVHCAAAWWTGLQKRERNFFLCDEWVSMDILQNRHWRWTVNARLRLMDISESPLVCADWE